MLSLADVNLYESKAKGTGAIVGLDEPAEEETYTAGSFTVLDALVTAVDKRDHYTRKHSEDVTEYCLMIARELGLSEETMRTLRIAGLLHDLGKIAIPDGILRKPGALTDEEFDVMKQHPVLGYLIVSAIPSLAETLPAIRHHHERWDGRGYPDKLAGEDIPLLGRLMAVPDAFSAMTTDRPYRKGLSTQEAIGRLREGVGTQFDRAMVVAFVRALGAEGALGSERGQLVGARAGGGTVRAPRGIYRFSGHLNVPSGVTLEGIWTSVPAHTGVRDRDQPRPTDDGTTFLVTEGAGQESGAPFITLNTNSTLRGVVL